MASIKRTMLELVQDILDELESDNVNDLDDTEEATRVTNMLIQTYWDIQANREIPEKRELVRLTALADGSRPTTLQIPDLVKKMHWWKYNKTLTTTKEFRDVIYEEPDSFIARLNSRDSSASNVVTSLTVDNSIELLVYNDKHPSYWSSFDNNYIICDSYDSDLDTTLQASKTQAWCTVYPTFTRAAATVLDLEESAMQYLYNETLAKASLRLNEQEDPHAVKWARRHRSSLQQTKFRDGNNINRRRYGRT